MFTENIGLQYSMSPNVRRPCTGLTTWLCFIFHWTVLGTPISDSGLLGTHGVITSLQESMPLKLLHKQSPVIFRQMEHTRCCHQEYIGFFPLIHTCSSMQLPWHECACLSREWGSETSGVRPLSIFDRQEIPNPARSVQSLLYWGVDPSKLRGADTNWCQRHTIHLLCPQCCLLERTLVGC